MDFSSIKGFNYQPSYGSSGLELWRMFDASVIDRELGLGKQHFPGMNAIRLWLSWDAFIREPARFAQNFDISLALAAKHGLRTMPVLFNRWHDADLDYGGTYIDHFLPGGSWVQRPRMFDAYLDAVVGLHRNDERILAWDLCNEPFAYHVAPEAIPDVAKAEFDWLQGTYHTCKQLGAAAPITVGTHQGTPLAQLDPICDFFSIHPYFTGGDASHFEASLDDFVATCQKLNKPLLATETCWGSLDDQKRCEIIVYTLDQLRQRNIGWLVYLLHHSLIADAHRPEFGPVGVAGNLAFIEADGTLRPGHGVFNDY